MWPSLCLCLQLNRPHYKMRLIIIIICWGKALSDLRTLNEEFRLEKLGQVRSPHLQLHVFTTTVWMLPVRTSGDLAKPHLGQVKLQGSALWEVLRWYLGHRMTRVAHRYWRGVGNNSPKSKSLTLSTSSPTIGCYPTKIQCALASFTRTLFHRTGLWWKTVEINPRVHPLHIPSQLVRTVIRSKSLLYLAGNSVMGNNCLEEKTSSVLSAQPNTTGVLNLLVGEAAGLDSDMSRVTNGKERSEMRYLTSEGTLLGLQRNHL